MFFGWAPIWLVAVIGFAVTVGGVEIGISIGARRYGTEGSEREVPIGVVCGAAFTLVALLLGFAFAAALGRFESRRVLTINEANAIGTTVLRSQALPAGVGNELRRDLKQYARARLDFALADYDDDKRREAGARSDFIAARMWKLAADTAQSDPRSTVMPIFLQSLNETIDLSTAQASARRNRMPDLVVAVLAILVAATAVLMGLAFGVHGTRGRLATTIFAVMLGTTLAVVVDLDRPQRGTIRIDPTPLQRALDAISP